MNLFELQENLKNFSQDQLVNEMRNPSGSAPQYLVLSELQRRRRIMQQEQAQMPQQEASVAEEAVAAAGMPQGGLAQMAQAMAPQTDVVQNTARMAEGGMIGGSRPSIMGDPLAPYVQHIDQTYMNPKIEQFVRDVRSMEQQRFGPPPMGSGAQPQFAGPMTPMSAQNISFMQQAPAPALELNASDPYDGMRNVGGQVGTPTNPLSGPGFSLGKYNPLTQGVLGGQGIAGLGVSRMSEGGLTGVSPRLTDFMPIGPSSRRASGRGLPITPMQMGQDIYEQYIEDIQRQERERRSRDGDLNLSMTADEINRAVNQDRDLTAGVADIMGIDDIRAAANANRRDLTDQEIMEVVGAPFVAEMDALADPELEGITEQAARSLGDLYVRGVEAAAETPIIRRGTRAPDFVTAIPTPAERVMLSQPDLSDDLRSARTADYNARSLAADAQRMGVTIPRDTSSPVEAEGSRGRSDRRGVESDFNLAEIFGSMGGATDPRASRQREMYGDNDVAPAIAPEIADTDDLARTLTESGGTPLGFSQDLTATEEELLPMVSDLSFGNLEAQREGTSAPAVAGGAAAPSGPSTDDLFEQDKWLALAQFGLGLMSSQAPTLGQAIGEAGTTGIAALMQAREDRRDREVAAQTRADRLAAAAARASDDEESYPYRQIDDIINMAESYERRAASIVEENAGMAPIEGDPGYEDYINNLALANTYRDYARQAIGIQ